MSKKEYTDFCKKYDIDPNDYDDVLFTIDELEGNFGDKNGKLQRIREYVDSKVNTGLEVLDQTEKEQITKKPLEYVNVYQLIENTGYRFMSYDFAKGKINLDDYKLVAKVPIYKEFNNKDELLEYVFAYGNSNEEYYKNNPEARSISMSDILQIGDNDNYYVDTFGFVYIGKGDKLTEAEIHTNQNNNIDLEKEKEDIQKQLDDVEELQAKKKELDDKVDELFEEKILKTEYITRYGDSNPDKIVPDAYCDIEKLDDGYYIKAGIGDHTSLGSGRFSIYPENYIVDLYKKIKELIKEDGVEKVRDKIKKVVPEYNALIPEYNKYIEDMITELTPYVEKAENKQITRKDIDSIEDIIYKVSPNHTGTLPEFDWQGKFGKMKSFIGNLKEYINRLTNPLGEITSVYLSESKEVKEESQVSNYTLEQVGSCLKDKGNDFKMQIQGSDTKTNWLNIDKDDLQKIYNTLSYKKKKTESVIEYTDDLFDEAVKLFNNNALTVWQLYIISVIINYIDYNEEEFENKDITIDQLVTASEDFNESYNTNAEEEIIKFIQNDFHYILDENKKLVKESAYDDLDIEPGSEEEATYNNLIDRNLKDEFNALSKEEQEEYLEMIPENVNHISSELVKELAELSDLDYDLLYWVINIRGKNINESKTERYVEFDVTIWHNEVNQRRIMNTLSDIIYDNAGELLDTSNMEIINFDKTKYTLQVRIDKDITEKQLDEKISDGIYDIGAEVDDISEYREIQPKSVIKESKDKNFPSSDFTSEKLSYNDIEESFDTFSKFKKFIKPEQEKWLIKNGFSVNELYEGLKEILTTFKSSAFKEVISIDEYINELDENNILTESKEDNEIFNGNTEVNLKLTDDTIIHIACDSNGEGYYYEIYDKDGNEIDGGLMLYEDGEVDRDVTVKEVLQRISEFTSIPAILDKDTVRIGDDEFSKLTDKVYDSDDYYYVLPNGKYLTFHKSLSEDGIDYTLYNADGSEDDGGILEIDSNNISKENILSELLKFIGMNDINSLDVDEIDEETFNSVVED